MSASREARRREAEEIWWDEARGGRRVESWKKGVSRIGREM